MKQRPHSVVRVEFRWGPSQAPLEGRSQAAVPGAGDPPGCREVGAGGSRRWAGGGSRRLGTCLGAERWGREEQALRCPCCRGCGAQGDAADAFPVLLPIPAAHRQAAILSFLTDEGPGLREAQSLFQHHTVIVCWAEIQRLL